MISVDRFVGLGRLSLLVVAMAGAGIAAQASDSCGSASDRAVRDWILATLEAREQGSIPPLSAAQWEKIREAAKQLRVGKGAALLPITRAPYFSALLLSQYPKLYRENLEAQIRQHTSPISLELLFDEVIRQVRVYQSWSAADQAEYRAQGGDQAEIASTADQLGTCLANNSAAAVSCGLDLSDQENVPSLAKQLYVRGTCTEGGWLDSWTACDYRRFVFDAAKPRLKALRERPSVIEQVSQKVKEKFDVEFPKLLAGPEGRKQLMVFNSLLATKWGASGVSSEMWTAQADLLVGGATGAVCLAELVQSLEVDIAIARASREAQSDAQSWSEGAAFLASAVNRFFLLNGGLELAIHPGVALYPSPAPHNVFGGIGAELSGYGRWIFDLAELGSYDPSGALAQAKARARKQKYGGNPGLEGPTPFRVFPERFVVSARGQIVADATGSPAQQVERLGDLARLARASVAFLRATRSTAAERGVLAPYFGSEEELGLGLMSESNPVTYPIEQGRGAALGILSGVIQNLSVPGRGHIDLLDLQDPQSGAGLPSMNMGLYAHDRVRLSGRILEPMQTEGMIALLGAASGLISDLQSPGGQSDPIYPQAFREATRDLGLAGGLLSLSLIGLGQRSDGAFKTELLPGAGTRITTTLRALSALSRLPEPKLVLNWPEAMRAGWKYVDVNRSQIDVLSSLEPALPMTALSSWDRTIERISDLGASLPGLRAWMESKRGL